MSTLSSLPTLGSSLHYDWSRRYFSHVPDPAAEQEILEAAFLWPGTTVEYLLRSQEGPPGAVLVARNPRPAPFRRRALIWHGNQRLVEETFQGWFGSSFRRVRSETFQLLLERLRHFVIADSTLRPTYVVPLPQFASLGVSHNVLESVLDARVVVAAEGLFARAAFVPSLRLYVEYDGRRYAHSTRKLFVDAQGHSVSVETVAKEALARLAYEVVPPVVFRRLFHALVGRPAAHFESSAWPAAFLGGRLSPLTWMARGQECLREAARRGLRTALLEALSAIAARPPYLAHPPPPGGLVWVGRYVSRQRFESLLDALGEERLRAVLEGLLAGYEAAAADWFAWQPGSRRAFFCEVKSRGDVLRPTQKETILWCQRSGVLEYRLLEVLHAA